MARIRLKENDELAPHIAAYAKSQDEAGVDTSNLRGFAHCQEMFDSYSSSTDLLVKEGLSRRR